MYLAYCINVHKSVRIEWLIVHKNVKGLRYSMLPFAVQDWMENIPLYATEAYFNKAGLGTGE